MDIEVGDILAVDGGSWLSNLIKFASGGGPVSHVAVITATVPIVQVTEALHRVVVQSLEDHLAANKHVWLLKPPLSPEDRILVCRAALKHVGKRYAYINILWQALDALTHSRWFTEHFVRLDHGDICSELITIINAALGLRPDDSTPNDIFEWFRIEKWVILSLK